WPQSLGSGHRLPLAPPAASARAPQMVVATLDPRQPAALLSLRAHATSLTHVLPRWLRLDEDGESFVDDSWDAAAPTSDRELERVARDAGLAVVPVLSNLGPGGIDGSATHRLLASAEAPYELAG